MAPRDYCCRRRSAVSQRSCFYMYSNCSWVLVLLGFVFSSGAGSTRARQPGAGLAAAVTAIPLSLISLLLMWRSLPEGYCVTRRELTFHCLFFTFFLTLHTWIAEWCEVFWRRVRHVSEWAACIYTCGCTQRGMCLLWLLKKGSRKSGTCGARPNTSVRSRAFLQSTYIFSLGELRAASHPICRTGPGGWGWKGRTRPSEPHLILPEINFNFISWSKSTNP